MVISCVLQTIRQYFHTKQTNFHFLLVNFQWRGKKKKRTHLSGSLKRMVAAQWKTMLTFSIRMLSSSLLRSSSGCVRSLLIAMIFSAKPGCSSCNLSNSWGKNNEVKMMPEVQKTGSRVTVSTWTWYRSFGPANNNLFNIASVVV